MSEKYYVYLLRSLKTRRFYIGYTTDLENRLKQHNRGDTFSTRAYKPWELVGFEEYEIREKALEREEKLKRNKRMQYFFKKRMISGRMNPTTSLGREAASKGVDQSEIDKGVSGSVVNPTTSLPVPLPYGIMGRDCPVYMGYVEWDENGLSARRRW